MTTKKRNTLATLSDKLSAIAYRDVELTHISAGNYSAMIEGDRCDAESGARRVADYLRAGGATIEDTGYEAQCEAAFVFFAVPL